MFKIHGYYFITAGAASLAGDLRDVRCAVAAGVRMVQYRDKSGSAGDVFLRARELRRLCGHKALFLMNDRVDIALAVDADGVHLGQDDMPVPIARRLLGKKRIIGVSTHSLAQARQAWAQGADYLAVGPIFPTLTKPGVPAVGISLLRRVSGSIPLPVVAIGGIILDNAPAVIAAGADALCAITAVCAQPDPGSQIASFQDMFKLK